MLMVQNKRKYWKYVTGSIGKATSLWIDQFLFLCIHIIFYSYNMSLLRARECLDVCIGPVLSRSILKLCGTLYIQTLKIVLVTGTSIFSTL